MSAGAAAADENTPPANLAARDENWATAIRSDLIRLAGIEWRLSRAATALCSEHAAATGIALDHIDAYPPHARREVRESLGLSDLPAVVAVMPDSPAARAGARSGDEVVTIGEAGPAQITHGQPRLAAETAASHLAALPPGQPARLLLRRSGAMVAVRLVPERACAARVVLKVDSRIRAFSDRRNVAITTGLVRFSRNDDELALVAGHELAHVIAQDSSTGSASERRAQEDAADELGARIAHCAGYDVGKALDFWVRFGRRDALGWLRSPTHRSTGARLERLRALVPGLTCPSDT